MTSPQPPTAPAANRLLRKFARSTSSGKYLPEIDGLRCVAILAVIVFHLAGYVAQKSPRPFAIPSDQDWTFRLARTGHIGVQLFFIISGFVVAMPFALHHLAGEKKVDLRQYFLRRLIRIEPPYVIALIFWMIAFGLSGLGPAPWREMLGHFPASLFYLHNLIYQAPSIIIPPAWSLEIEIQFYVLAPLLVSVFAIKSASLRQSILCTAIVALAIAQRWLRNPGQINGLNLEQEGHYFLIGLLLVDLHVTWWRHRPARLPLLGDLLATACLAGLIGVLVHNPADHLRVPVLLMLACAAMLRSRLWRAALRNPWIYTTGGMCYTIYLYHGFFKAFVGHFTIHWQIGDSFTLSFLFQSVILIPIILAGSAVLFLLTEKPFMRIRPKFQRGLRKPSQI